MTPSFLQIMTRVGLGTALALAVFSVAPARAQSCDFTPQYAYKAPNSSAVYYITDKCTKRAFTKSNIFFTYFSSWGAVEAAPRTALQAVPTDPLGFMPYGPLYDPKYGALVKTVDDPKVYLLLGNKKYWITSEEVFNALRYQWNWIEDVDPRLLAKYGQGSEITDTARHPDFTLIKYSGDPKVYRLEPGAAGSVKRHIADEQAFAALGFRADRIVTLPASEQYPDGAPITKQDVQPPALNNPAPAQNCVSNPNPVFTNYIVDPATVLNILPPPNIHTASGHLKTHSYITNTALGIPIYAPADMELIGGAHYVGGPFSLDFRVSCEVTLRLAHINPVQKIKDQFPATPAVDSRNQPITPGAVTFKAGDIVAYVYQDVGVLSVGLDFGVYHSGRPNKYAASSDPEITRSTIYTTAVCPYDFFTPAIRDEYRAKYNLQQHGGMTRDGELFCQ